MLRRKLPLLITVIALVGALILNPIPGRSANKEQAKNSLNNDEKILHVLNRLGYGPRPGDVERVKQIGIDKYIDLQLNPEKIDDDALEARLKHFSTLDMDAVELVQAYPLPKALNGKKKNGKKSQPDQDLDEEGAKRARVGKGIGNIEIDPADVKGRPQEILLQLSQQHLLRAVYSERQLNEMMVDFWTNHFNVFWAKGADRYLLTPYIRDAIRPNAMGNFRELLTATAHSPAMLFYLDNWTSVDPKAAERTFSDLEGLKKRMERRKMQRGRFNGGLGLDDDEKAMRNRADQADLKNKQKKRRLGLNENYARELLELHTMGVDGGYTQKDVTEAARCLTGWSLRRDGDEVKFNFNERLHDQGEKIVLGEKISAGGGMRDGEKVLEILMKHPSTARFISTKLVRRFVSDNPPQPLVDRVAAVFAKTGGDIRAMLKTIFSSSEFFARESYQAKVKSPLALVASALRAVDADTDAGRQTLFSIARMGQPLYLCQPPTGYGDTADKWVNTSSLVERLNFAVALCEGRIPGTTPRLLRNGASPASLDAAIDMLMHGSVSQSTRDAILKEIGVQGFAAERLPKVAGLLLGSPEFQKM